jgi:HAD superfamily hydrolase (TIGR01549 family)
MLLLGLPEKDLPDFIAFAHTLATKRLPEAPLHEGAYTMLETLKKQGKKIAIFSTMDRPIFEPMLKFHNLHLLVTVAIAGTDVPHRKPHPEGLIKALEDLTVPTTEYKKVVYIGDKDTDIQTAHNAGVDAMLYYPKTHQALYSLQELKRHNPEFIINNWQELIV